MKQLAIISGKGGTGKTTIAASFAALADNAVIVDADVDAANMHLLLNPESGETGEYIGGKKAYLDSTLCTHCDECRQNCHFNAISEEHEIDLIACEGCGLCSRLCPVEAIEMKPAVSGAWYDSETRYGPFVHAKLGIAAENSGKLVSVIREIAKKKAEAGNRNLIIIDGSPGVGCPVIASVTGCDLLLCITEPTQSGLHDLKRVVELARHFNVPIVAAINKYDLNESMTNEIMGYCQKNDIRVMGKIPFDEAVVKSIAAAMVLVEYSSGACAQAIKSLWKEIRVELTMQGGQDHASIQNA